MSVKEYRVGMLIPWVNTVMEDEIPLQIDRQIGLHWTRLRPKLLPNDGHDNSYMASMIKQIPSGIASFDGIPISAICLGCTSASFDNSFGCLKQNNKSSQIKFFTAFEAVIIKLKKLNAKKISLFAPYDLGTIKNLIKGLSENGIEVINSTQIQYKKEIRNIRQQDLKKLLSMTEIKNVDAILFSCTGLYTMNLFKEIKDEFNLKTPVLSSNSSISDLINSLYRVG